PHAFCRCGTPGAGRELLTEEEHAHYHRRAAALGGQADMLAWLHGEPAPPQVDGGPPPSPTPAGGERPRLQPPRRYTSPPMDEQTPIPRPRQASGDVGDPHEHDSTGHHHPVSSEAEQVTYRPCAHCGRPVPQRASAG